MDTFAKYILNENNLVSKMEIVYYLSKKEPIYFDKSIIVKTELARLFLKYSNLDLDENLVLTACLLCNCKKVKNGKNIDEIKNYAKDGAEYLQTLGFDKKFCKISEQVNRYSESKPRESESDVLELVEQFGGMILDRPERIGMKSDEAIVLLVHKNLKNEDNRYVDTFSHFIDTLEEVDVGEFVEISAIDKLVKIYNDTEKLTDFINKITNQFEPQIDGLMDKKIREQKGQVFENVSVNNRALFTDETTREILKDININVD